MAVTTSTAVKNARLDAISSTWGASPKLRLYSGTPPTNAATALSGNNLLAEVTPTPAAASNASKDMLGGAKSTTGTAAAGTGTTATFYRVYDSGGTTCHEQGTVAQSGGDVTIDNPSIAQNQAVNINTFTKTEP